MGHASHPMPLLWMPAPRVAERRRDVAYPRVGVLTASSAAGWQGCRREGRGDTAAVAFAKSAGYGATAVRSGWILHPVWLVLRSFTSAHCLG